MGLERERTEGNVAEESAMERKRERRDVERDRRVAER